MVTASVAGCSGDDNDNREDDAGGETGGMGVEGTATATATTTDVDTTTDADSSSGDDRHHTEKKEDKKTEEKASEAEFEVDHVHGATEMSIGRTTQFTIEVSNVGDADGTWRDTIVEQFKDDVRTIDLGQYIPAREWRQVVTDEVSFDYKGIVRYSFQNDDYEWSIDIEPLKQDYRDSYTNPEDIETVVQNVDFSQSYEWSSSGEEYTEESNDGMQYAWVYVRVENVGNQSNDTPFEQDITISPSPNQQYEYEDVKKDDGRYEPGDIAPDVVREGWIAYQIPEDLSNGEFLVTYSDSDDFGEWEVRWLDYHADDP